MVKSLRKMYPKGRNSVLAWKQRFGTLPRVHFCFHLKHSGRPRRQNLLQAKILETRGHRAEAATMIQSWLCLPSQVSSPAALLFHFNSFRSFFFGPHAFCGRFPQSAVRLPLPHLHLVFFQGWRFPGQCRGRGAFRRQGGPCARGAARNSRCAQQQRERPPLLAAHYQ